MSNNYGNPNDTPRRQPYQYPPQRSRSPENRLPNSPYGPGTPPDQPGQYNQSGQRQPYKQPGQQGYYNQPRTQTPAPTAYPYSQPGPQSQPRRHRRKGCMIGCLGVLAALVIFAILAGTTISKVLAFGSAISTKAPLSTDTGYMNTSDRTNLLVMGYGGGMHDGAYLTDSMLIISVLPQSHHTSLISVPRDLWVQYPPSSGNYSKLNAVYELASNNNNNPQAGGDAANQKVSLVTGMQVNYWLTIDFTGFKKVIDSIGGIDVNVPDSFNACYPKNDDASIDPSWIKVQFDKGMQHMNGDTAITYARAREPLEVCGQGTSENLAELSDFGRSARQQIIIKAVLAKTKQISTWSHLYDAMGALQQTIHTNMSFADLSAFALKMDLTDPKAARIGLSNQNVLEDSQLNGQYILTAANGDWNAIPAYIQQRLYA
jgi:polyisoprenyl-teichoic acid--peptidoglycan teichoic acid transferase